MVAAAFVLKAGAHTGTHEQRQGFRRRDAEQASGSHSSDLRQHEHLAAALVTARSADSSNCSHRCFTSVLKS